MKTRTASSILMLLLVVAPVASPLVVHMQAPYLPSIGMSGSFYTFSGITLPRGGSFNSSDMYIVVYNYGGKEANVTLEYEAPKGITILFNPNETSFTLKPNEHKRMNVIIMVSKNMTPGTYKIAITAKEVVEKVPGKVVVVPAVTQEINITVVGEYSMVHVYALDPSGQIARTALVRLYTRFKGGLVSIRDSYNGELHALVIPGNYTVRVYLAGDLVAEENVTLRPYENRTLRLTLKIVFVEFFSIKPIVTAKNELIAARLKLVVKNVYKTISDASMILRVYKDGAPWENRTLMESSILPPGRVEYTFDYIPSRQWQGGNYTFTVEIYGMGGKLLARSEPKWLYYQPPAKPIYIYITIAVTTLVVLLLLVALLRRRKRR